MGGIAKAESLDDSLPSPSVANWVCLYNTRCPASASLALAIGFVWHNYSPAGLSGSGHPRPFPGAPGKSGLFGTVDPPDASPASSNWLCSALQTSHFKPKTSSQYSSIINHTLPLSRGRVARIVPEFRARTTPRTGATPCVERNKESFARRVFYLFNCCTNDANRQLLFHYGGTETTEKGGRRTAWKPGTDNWELLFNRRHRPEHGRRMNADERDPARSTSLRARPEHRRRGKLFGRNREQLTRRHQATKGRSYPGPPASGLLSPGCVLPLGRIR
jgi:hypothetical protein